MDKTMKDKDLDTIAKQEVATTGVPVADIYERRFVVQR